MRQILRQIHKKTLIEKPRQIMRHIIIQIVRQILRPTWRKIQTETETKQNKQIRKGKNLNPLNPNWNL